jgi:hypothetical protein
MPPVRRCAPKRPVRAAGLSLQGPEDALGVLLAGATPDRPSATYLLLDATHCGITCLEVAGRGDAEAVVDVAELLLHTAGDEPRLAALIIATFRPGRSHVPEPGDTWCFGELRDLLADAGIDLLDWFVVGGGFATSLAEISGAPWLWRTPPDDRPG